MNCLNAVFWDYPQFVESEVLKKYLQEKKGTNAYLWLLNRFLEHGRVVDTLTYFTIDEISELLPDLKLSNYTIKKYRRIIEVYGTLDRK